MNTYEHSVHLDEHKCTGCTTCLRHCPTEAIRVRDGHAVIDEARCIDCGECIRVCPHKAKKAVCNTLEAMDRFKWKIALPAPALYGQFDNLDDVDYVLGGLLRVGFDDVFEVSKAAELVSAYTRFYLNTEGVKKPVISSACPAVLRLISLRYPSLEENVMHMLPPMEIAAKLARDKAKREHPEFSDEEIGVCFISPCPAKASYVKNGFGGHKSQVDAVVSIRDIYFLLINAMSHSDEIDSLSSSGMVGIGGNALHTEKKERFQTAHIFRRFPDALHVQGFREAGRAFHAYTIPDGGDGDIIEVHVGKRGEQGIFHHRVQGGRTLQAGAGGESDEFTDNGILKVGSLGFLAADTGAGTGLAACGLFTLEAKHLAHKNLLG